MIEFLHKIFDVVPSGIRVVLVSIVIGFAIYLTAEAKGQRALSANLDLHSAHTNAISEAALANLPVHPDSRLNGKAITILPPTIEQRRVMLKNFEKIRAALSELANDPNANPTRKTSFRKTIRAYNDLQEKYLNWSVAQDEYEPWRKWQSTGYSICALFMLGGLVHWRSTKKPKSRIILPA